MVSPKLVGNEGQARVSQSEQVSRFPAPATGPLGEDNTVNKDSLSSEGSPDVQWTAGKEKSVRRWTGAAVYNGNTY